MSSSVAKPNDAAEPAANLSAGQQLDAYFVRQLQRATGQIKLIDLIAGLAQVAVATLAGLLVVCFVDAWIIPLPGWLRLAILASMVSYAIFVFARHLIPLFVWRINPAYAARMIENASPGLKNSLLNYLFLRSLPAGQRSSVYGAVRQRAAQDLSAISIESSVDRGRLIRIGFALVGVVLAGGMYKLLSPKDPVQTLRRVFSPLADVPAPSRVQIVRVEPGSVELFFGEALEVRAEIRGAAAATQPTLLFTSDDGQYVHSPVPMVATDRPREYAGVLAPTSGGIRQSLTYWVAAGDGRSSDYRVHVRPVPTIAVTAVELEPPAYTELPQVQREGIGDFEGYEGSRVRVTAAANQPIASAYLEFLRARPREGDSPLEFQSLDRLAMESSGDQARGAFQLPRLGNPPPFTHYRIRFNSSEGQASAEGSAYAIKIRPDIAPELTVEQPAQTEIQVPRNANLPIAARASDPDFKLSSIWLYVAHKGKLLLQQNLPLDPKSGVGSVSTRFHLRPQSLGLQVGDEAVLYLIAKDNRHSLSGEFDANQTRSANYTLRIIAADPNQPADSQSNQGNPSGASSPQPNSDGQPAESPPNQPNRGADQKQPGADPNAGDEEAQNDQGNSDGNSTEQNPDPQNSDNASQSGAGGMTSSGDQGNNASSQPSEQGGGAEGQSAAQANSQNSSNSQASGSQPADPSSAANASPASSDPSNQPSPNESTQPNPGTNPSTDNSSANQTDSTGNESLDDNAPLNDFSSDGQRMQRLLKRAQDQSQQPDRNQVRSEGGIDDPNSESNQNNAASASPPDKRGDSAHTTRNDSNSQSNQGNQGNPPNQPGENSAESNPGDRSDQSQPQNSGAAGNRGEAPPQAGENSGDNQGENSGNRPGDNPGNRGENKPGDGAGQNPQQGDSESSASGKPQPNSQNSTGQGDQAKPETASDSSNPNPAGQQPPDSGAQPGSQSNTEANPDDQAGGADENRGEQNQPSSASEQNPDLGEPSAAESTDSPQNAANPPRPSDGGAENDNSNSQAPQPSDSAAPSAANNSSGQSSGRAEDRPPQATPPRDRDANGARGEPQQSGAGNQFNPTSDDPTDKEILETSRQATDLVLDYLRDQQQQPDPSLLNEMNWTETEMREFLRRWEAMRAEAERGDADAVARFEESLRSLGLGPSNSQVRRNQMRKDVIENLNEDSAISRPPSSRESQYREFLRRRSQADN